MLEEVVNNLKKMTTREVMILSLNLDVPYDTLNNIKYGRSKDPRVNIIQKLHDHFQGAK